MFYSEETRAVLALSMVPKLGLQRVRALVQHTGSARSLFKKNVEELISVPGIGLATADLIVQFNQWDRIEKFEKKAEQLQVTVISFMDECYPKRLLQIYDAPLILWVKGSLEVLDSPGLAIVGTRNPTPYGHKMTSLLTTEAVKKGLTVYSGLAYGVDTIAHRTAIEKGGRTVAVLGSGIDWIYPASNKKLAERIVQDGGAIITEYLPGTKPDAGNFPIRNRIVSGLSLGVLVVETSEKGGSRITANIALDQGREVFVVPHALDNPHGTGCNELIKKGYGKLVQDFEDIAEEIQWEQEEESSKIEVEPKVQDFSGISEELQKVVAVIVQGAHQVDEIAEKLEMSTQDVLVRLLELEFANVVVQRAGKMFYLAD